MTIEHKHVIVRAEVRKAPGKEDISATRKWFRKLVKNLDMKLLGGPYLKYVDKAGNVGLTGVCIIETSNINLHVWEEPSPQLMQCDVYTCGSMDLNVVFDALKQFDPVKISYKYLDREHDLIELDAGTINYET